MPYYKKKICAKSGCTNYATDGAFCEEHKPKRGTTSKFTQFYKTSYWQKARKQFLLSNIWCVNCLKNGKHTLADTVHHTVGFSDFTSFCDQSKWVAICSSCHSKIHIEKTNEDLWREYNGK